MRDKQIRGATVVVVLALWALSLWVVVRDSLSGPFRDSMLEPWR